MDAHSDDSKEISEGPQKQKGPLGADPLRENSKFGSLFKNIKLVE